MSIRNKQIFNPDESEFREVYEKLNNRDKVADYYGVSQHYVREFAKSIGLYDEKKLHITDEQIQFILDSYEKYPASALAKKFHTSGSYISALWSKAGLKGKKKRTYAIDQTCFDSIDSEEKAYALGFIASDGCIYKSDDKNKQAIVRITIHNQDENVLLDIRDRVFKSDKPISHIKCYSSIEIVSDHICEQLESLGLHVRKTYGNTIVELDDNLMKHFVRGYFDGDGSISTKIQSGKFYDVGVSISGYKKNMMKIANYLEKMNIYTGFTIDERKNGNALDDFGSLFLTSKITKYSFLRLLYDDAKIYMPRKKELADKFVCLVETDDRVQSKVIKTYYENAVLSAS